MVLLAPRLHAAPGDGDPFEALYAVPQGVDAAAVFNDPARTLLLSDSGRSVRSLLAGAGVFTHTEHAWEALAQAMGDDTDGTITALLGGRVVVVWDGIGAGSGTVTGLADAIDTRWALMCEVDQSYLKQIRDRLKPVKRDIVQGRPLYAIEKGRYGIVLLDAPENDQPASVLLAPSTGTKLLGQMLASTLQARGGAGGVVEDAQGRSIMQDRAALVAQLPGHHDGVGASSWAVAWLIQTDRLGRNQSPDPSPAGSRTLPSTRPGRALAGLVSIDGGGMRLSFASDLTPDPALGDAPAGLLDAVGDDAVLALAMARFPPLLSGGHTMSLRFPHLGPADPDDPPGPDGARPEHDDFFASPGLVVLSQMGPGVSLRSGASVPDPDANKLALSVLVRRPTRPGADPFAASADRAMHELLSGYDPAQAPDYGGDFPDAVRTQTIMMAPTAPNAPAMAPATGERGTAVAPKPAPAAWAWPGGRPSLSWVSADLHHAGVMAATLAPRGCDTSARVRAMSRAAATLAAIDDRPADSGVLLRGYVRPARLFELMGDGSGMELTISRFIDKVSCDIARSPGGGIRGAISVELSARPGRANLGNRGD